MVTEQTNGLAGSTLIGVLASTLATKQSLLIAIVKTKDNEVLVTVQPTPTDKDNGSAIALQVKGKPEEIDAELVKALESFVPARQFVLKTATEVAEATKAAAAKGKIDAPKKPGTAAPKAAHTATPAKAAASTAGDEAGGGDSEIDDEIPDEPVARVKANHPGRLTITVDPPDATITALANGQTFTLVSGEEENLPIGIHSIKVSKDGYVDVDKNLAVSANPRAESFTLAKALELFGDEGAK